ncbi:NCS2 family permease [Scopulibacillus cellulosilyticus]|uniref:NCS2 family permease n=1 Tax=Scopulibacillus cellulosilyticus TaxID=2665665 RepID=A0ABW2PVQ0_9BACL
MNNNWIARYFGFSHFNTSFRQETVAGLTTFLSMAYILFVNPTILSDAGMNKGAVFTATAIATAFGTLVMGIVAKYPIAIAPGMGTNAFFTYTVVIGMGIPWQTALAGVLVAGIIFLLITVFRLREMIINAIPEELKRAAAAGIGIYIAFIGLKGAGIIVANKDTLVSLGDLSKPGTLLSIFGLLVTIILVIRNVKGGIFYGLVITAIAGMIFKVVPLPHHIVSSVPSVTPTLGAALSHITDIKTMNLIVVVITFLFVVFFDTAGTIIAIASQAGFIKNNKLPRIGRALFADSSSTVVGALVGTSPTSTYIESSAGVAAGGRTGFTSVVVGIMFLFGMFFSPLLTVVTSQITAPALIIVGVLMAGALKDIDWGKLEIAIPAFLTVVGMPLSYSIATGIALGFIIYPISMAVKGRIKDVHPIVYVLFVIFILYFIFLS